MRREGAGVLPPHLPQLGELRVPGRTRLLRAVEDPAVGGQRLDADLAQPLLAEAGHDVLGGGAVAARAAHAVVAGDLDEVAQG